MNQYAQPPPPHVPLPTDSGSPTSTSEMMVPPMPHPQSMYYAPLEAKSECWPPGHGIQPPQMQPPSNESEALPPLCAGCRLRIEDKFYLSAVDVKWHSACLKCAECGVELETQSSCFERDGHIYCREDYRRYNFLIFFLSRIFYLQFEFLQDLQCQQMRPVPPRDSALRSSHESQAVPVSRRLLPVRHLRSRLEERRPLWHV